MVFPENFTCDLPQWDIADLWKDDEETQWIEGPGGEQYRLLEEVPDSIVDNLFGEYYEYNVSLQTAKGKNATLLYKSGEEQVTWID